MLVTKRVKGDEILDLEMTEEHMKKGYKSWSGYYSSNQLYCVDEDANKTEFFWNVKELISEPACPVDYDDYKMNANSRSRVATNISEITTNNITENSSIKNGVVLSVEGLNNEAYESSTDNCENGHCLQFQMNKLNIDNETTDILKDTSDNPHYLQFEMPKTKTNDETYEISKDNSENPHYLQFDIPKTAINEDISEMSKDNSDNGYYLQFEVPKPKLNSDEIKGKAEDIANNKKTDQNGTNTKSEIRNTKKIRIKSKKENKVKKSVKEKLKLLYTNVSFVLLLISLSMFLFGTSVVFTHILPYAESENVSSSIGLLLVSVLGAAALVGKIGLGAIAQLPPVSPIVLYIITVFLCGMYFLLKNINFVNSKCYIY